MLNKWKRYAMQVCRTFWLWVCLWVSFFTVRWKKIRIGRFSRSEEGCSRARKWMAQGGSIILQSIIYSFHALNFEKFNDTLIWLYILQVTHSFDKYPNGVRYLRFYHGGMDNQFWAGINNLKWSFFLQWIWRICCFCCLIIIILNYHRSLWLQNDRGLYSHQLQLTIRMSTFFIKWSISNHRHAWWTMILYMSITELLSLKKHQSF